MFHTYILYSPGLDKYYVGSTNDLERRLQDHNRGKGKFSRQGGSWELKYYETFETRPEAFRREQEIKKKKSRIYIEWLISSVGSGHPDDYREGH